MQYDYFPVSMSAFEADINFKEISEETISFGSVIVDWEEQVCHPGGSVRYRVNLSGKKVVYATDVELNLIFGSEKSNEGNKGLAQEYLDFIYKADLLIADGQFTEEEYATKVGWGHSSIPVILDLAYQAKVKQLAIFHHDPQHSDKFLDDLWFANRSRYHFDIGRMEVFWAREGMTLSI
jgi:ribonuclease BN (tRNA processing enzyme)